MRIFNRFISFLLYCKSLDIKIKEQDEASYMKYVVYSILYIKMFDVNLFRKTKTYLPPRFMTTSQAASQILESAKQLQLEDGMVVNFY
jgi:hypothetical protein